MAEPSKHRQFVPVDREKILVDIRKARLADDIPNFPLPMTTVALVNSEHEMAHDIEAVPAQILEPARREVERLETQKYHLAVNQAAPGKARAEHDLPSEAEADQPQAAHRRENNHCASGQIVRRLQQ